MTTPTTGTDAASRIAGRLRHRRGSRGPRVGGDRRGRRDPAALVRIPLATFNRHGLVAGATGTGKTKTLQVIAEQLSAAGVPVLMPDVKGDLTGLLTAGEPGDRR